MLQNFGGFQSVLDLYPKTLEDFRACKSVVEVIAKNIQHEHVSPIEVSPTSHEISCKLVLPGTANALAAAYHFTLHKQNVENHAGFKDFTPSRLFIYYNERYMEGSVDRDAGAMLRDGIKCMEKLGVCPEVTWKYLGVGIFENSMSWGLTHGFKRNENLPY